MKKGNKWQDHFARRAKQEKWLARSVYKLQQIDGKYKLVRKGDRLLDLGCYPGSWSQYLLRAVGSQGEVVGFDLLEPVVLDAPNFRFIKGDALRIEIDWLAKHVGPRDCVLSDLAPKTTGVRTSDSTRSLELSQRALEIALSLLKEGGNFLCKVFEGEGLKEFRDSLARHFRDVRAVRPAAVRKGSREIYILGLKFMGG
ncbi:MAG: RlmE family RNA methyltransferase [Deltaproteobacteria bacterium]|nr:RlmE family RNA methyltransferase [Deltaproteobacteria bacterium]